MPRVPHPVLSTVVCLLLACVTLFAGGLHATTVRPVDDNPALTTVSPASEAFALTARDHDADHDALPLPADSEPATGHGRASAPRRPLQGRYPAFSMHDDPRARSPAYRGCGPPR